MLGKIAWEAIEKERPVLDKMRMDMWNNPEGAFREYKACEWISSYLKEKGFEVEVGVGGVPTAIKATWGKGHPVIGLLGELDALPGMSQKVCTHKEPAVEGGYGQACGHNLLGVAHVGGAIGIKAELEASGKEGTVVYYGCPAEEVLTGKGFMARGGAFDGLDMCIAFHPSAMNSTSLSVSNGLNSAVFNFKGITAHAGGDPYNGRSALDAVELMNVGANYLREHVKSDVRIHYVITNGGMAPNIVPDRASVWYYVRAPKRELVNEVYERLVKVAKGAAMMTETEVEIDFKGGCYETMNNKVLVDVMYETLKETPQDPWTEEEIAFAKALNEASEPNWTQRIEMTGLTRDDHLFTGVAPVRGGVGGGSTDVGDVQHICPGVFFNTACYALGVPGHSWQIAACTGSSIGEKGMTMAARAMALCALKVIEDPQILAKAKEEFDASMGGKKYICPVPDEVPVP